MGGFALALGWVGMEGCARLGRVGATSEQVDLVPLYAFKDR